MDEPPQLRAEQPAACHATCKAHFQASGCERARKRARLKSVRCPCPVTDTACPDAAGVSAPRRRSGACMQCSVNGRLRLGATYSLSRVARVASRRAARCGHQVCARRPSPPPAARLRRLAGSSERVTRHSRRAKDSQSSLSAAAAAASDADTAGHRCAMTRALAGDARRVAHRQPGLGWPDRGVAARHPTVAHPDAKRMLVPEP